MSTNKTKKIKIINGSSQSPIPVAKETMKDIYRFTMIEKLNEILGEEAGHAVAIENSIYKFSVEKAANENVTADWNNKFFKRIYFNKCISIYTNLKTDSYVKNPQLYTFIKDGTIDIEKIAYMKPMQIFPDHWKQLLEKKTANDEFLYLKKPGAITDQWKCGKCKENKCTYYQLQIRSSDEPMTTFVTCVNCCNRWNF